MKRKLSILISAVLLFVSSALKAQKDPTNYHRADLIPSSPTAANLGKYGDVPVTMYSGTPNVSIPVFTVQGQDISLPISLTYNYNGARPNDQISWIGLGWSLQAGGVITRQVRSLVDVNGATGPSAPYQYENLGNIHEAATPNSELSTILAQAHIYDLEPDLYNFNFGGYSGKFIKVSGKFYIFPAQKLKIAGDGTTGFSITTEDGTRYDFDETELTHAKSDPSNTNLADYYSAYYLTKITNPAQTDFIKLTYSAEGQLVQKGAWSQTYDRPEPGMVLPSGPYGKDYNLYPATISMPTFVNLKRLTAIYSTKFTVNFFNDVNPRQDFQMMSGGSYALAAINVMANGGGQIKQFELDHDYFNGTSGAFDDKYLRLKSVRDISYDLGETPGPNIVLKHTFQYEEGLPKRLNPFVGVDHYGYYNNHPNTTLVSGTLYSSGMNKSPNPVAAKAGILTKVTYPTGASSTFEYEQNAIGGGFGRSHFYIYRTVERPDYSTTNQLQNYTPLDLDAAQMVRITLGRLPKVPWYGDDSNKDNKEDEIVIYNSSGTEVHRKRINSTALNGAFADSASLPAGHYNILLVCDRSENWTYASIDYTKQDVTAAIADAPGLRIKKVTSNPLIGSPVIKQYYYANGKSLLPTYAENHYIQRIHVDDVAGYYYEDYPHVSYSAYLTEGQIIGAPFYYGEVTEFTGADTIKALKSVYTFQSYDNGSNFLGVDPQAEFHYKKAEVGYTLLSSKIYEYAPVYDEKVFVTLRPRLTMQETWPHGDPSFVQSFYEMEMYMLASQWKNFGKITETIYNPDTLVTTTYNEYSKLTRNLVNVRQTLSDGTATTQKLKYPEDYASSVTGTLVGANIVTPIEKQLWRRRSATDSVLVGGTITEYNTTYLKPEKIHALESITGLAALDAQAVNSEFKYTSLISDSRYKQKVTYGFDAFGKINKQQLTDGPASAYQYGYHPGPNSMYVALNLDQTNYPVAECKNCTPAEFFTQNFEDVSSAAVDAAHTGRKYYNGSSYTATWAAPGGRSYVISYWYKTGGNWAFSGELAYNGTSYTMTNGTAYDDIRIYPTDAQLSTYTYLIGVGVSSTIDAKGLTSYYEYDNFNRLLNVKDQYGRILKNNTYNYGTAKFSSKEVKQEFDRLSSTCTAGQIGGKFIYVVPGGKYTSEVSQDDADSQANAEAASYGQNVANAQAACLPSVALSLVKTTNGSVTLNSIKLYDTDGILKYTFPGYLFDSTHPNYAPPSVPRANYTFEYSISGSCYDFNSGNGWSRIWINDLQSTEVQSICNSENGGIYRKAIDLSETATAVIKLEAENLN